MHVRIPAISLTEFSLFTVKLLGVQIFRYSMVALILSNNSPLNLSPTLPVLWALSDPARSTK